MRKLFAPILCSALALPGLALAAPSAPSADVLQVNNALSGVALDATAATRTVTASFDVKATNPAPYSKWRVSVFYTYSAATTVTSVFSCSQDGTNYSSLTSRSIAAGASAVSIVTDTYTTGGASANITLEYDVQGCRKAKVVLGGASAGAGDLVTVDWTAIVGG
jgi:hypothetical protein